MSGGHDLVAVGASWGGLDALRTVLGGLPAELDAAVVVAQHRSPRSHSTALRDLLGAVTFLEVREAGDKDELWPGQVLLAPPDYHLLVEGDRVALSTEAMVRFSRPSIDVLLESAADARRERLVGVILTGANEDGAAGLARVKELGGYTVVQDPADAERPEMPRAALAAVEPHAVLPLAEIPALLVRLCGTVRVPA